MRKLCLAVLSSALAVPGQTPLAFEVASIKPTTAAPGPRPGFGRQSGGPGTSSPGQFTSTGNSLSVLLFQTAYQFVEYQYAAPSWMDKECYDVIAKVPPGITREQFREMLAKLLVDRFQIKFHHEQREMITYELTVAKSGVKMKPSEVKDDAPYPERTGTVALERDADGFFKVPPGPSPMTFSTGINRQAATVTNRFSITQLASQLQRNLKHPVIDKTDLKGNWAFLLHYASESVQSSGAVAATSALPAETDVDVAPTVFQALESQLGLKLTQKKAPVDVMVIDSGEKTPLEN